MLMKNLAAVAALSLMAAPVAAQSSAASALSVRAGATTGDQSELAGGGLWAALIGVALVAAFILVVIEDDDVDLPDSP